MVSGSLDRGLVDFGFLSGEIDTSHYESLRIPQTDSFGILMRKDSPLAEKDTIFPEDIIDAPLIVSRQMLLKGDVGKVLKCSQDKLNIAATYSLLYNGSLMVDEGLGYALCFDKIINVTGDSSTRQRSTCYSNTCLNSFCVINHTSFDIEKPATLKSIRIAGGFIILGCYSALISFSNSLTALMTFSKVGTSP